jgi:Gti1/Pac2 family transcription factor
MSQTPLKPTYTGFVYSTLDALILFEACLRGVLNHVARRPHDRERSDLIRSGNVFIYEENASGIKRWTDGVPWSPSRILGNFLVYRELEKAFPPGEKKKALKKQKKPTAGGITKAEARSPSASATVDHMTAAAVGLAAGASSPRPSGCPSLDDKESDKDRYLIGSLVDSYPFKEKGLVKKTISISYRGVPHHLVSYYSVEDARVQLRTPTHDDALGSFAMQIRPELLSQQNFRVALEQDETSFPHGPPHLHAAPHGAPPHGAMIMGGMHPHLVALPMPPPHMQPDMQRRLPMASSSMAGVPQDHPPHLDLVQSYSAHQWQPSHAYDEGMSHPQGPLAPFASHHQFGDAAARQPHYPSRASSLSYAGDGDSRSMAMAALNVGSYTGNIDHEADNGPEYSHQPAARPLVMTSQFAGQTTGTGHLGAVIHPSPAHRQYQVDGGACMPLDSQGRSLYSRVPAWPQDAGAAAVRQAQSQGVTLDTDYLPSRR